MVFSLSLGALAALVGAATAQVVNPTIAQINGNKFLSPLNGQNVTGVRGLVTAKGPNGFFLRSQSPDRDASTSESIYVFGRTVLDNVTVGNVITLNGRVTEYRPTTAAGSNYLFLTEIDRPSNITTISTGNPVVPIVIGQRGLNPPTEQYSVLDNGDVFAVPNNQSRVSVRNPTLDPRLYGLDFWESLTGELVTVRRPRAVARPNSFGDTWVVGDWSTTGDNSRGGLTLRDRDANPEAILIGSPLDGTSNPNVTTKLGDSLEEITGVVFQDFGFYRILPTTAIKVTRSKSPALPPATRLRSNGRCSGITVGQYNIENYYSGSPADQISSIGDHIANFLRSPDLIMVQEVQDDNGPTNDAIVDANVSLSTLRDSITAAGSAVNYSFVDIDPVDDQDGGQPGGNIRTAYLYNPNVIQLRKPNPGSPTDANEVLPGPSLKFNPGRIDPANAAWGSSRKPLAAQWETKDGQHTFFTINVHWTSKGGSTSLHGDPRPPVNQGVDTREQQANITGSFVKQILNLDRNAAVVLGGDYNEFQYVQPLKTLAAVSGLRSFDDVAGIRDVEQYTYLFDMNSQELDHFYVSPRLNRARADYEHIHVNTWVTTDEQASDHDPSVARFNFCK
ncbi:hypothetical protein CLAFUW4_03857 [Fulvia fulva]|uniref:Endonuclease/exonuclease/phosphatase domain-containing protein n=1 Tax=Passalora fulva TaxID=5499 RepID=A0A9Q8P5V2_PASFU|nr:uncharacterized protein CLAFUR5_03829 [Fulvia fulva]KAK4631779.1 hypothetical protein CLAFUR4_03845 [Fulvia fulva]KAK4632516.1 hypothetical protein CLAFUR0_03844 [Fulvia fulva]UJO14505.1 hypothetical protein CLAFUR5_03829 [Fulvia fulva]WPV12022.1 hypothetical protein CLAFUW4_03857 [Fulvia fulva]WPV25855.1 hypothetical protein CLAFUW7_03849 [Fulvia fulva]